MTVEEKVQGILINKPTVTSIVPADRIKPPGDWQGLQRPYIVHFPVADEPIHTHEGLATLRPWRFYQVTVYADTYGAAAQLRDVVVKALDGYADSDVNRIAYLKSGSSHYDTDRKIQEIALNFEVTEGASLSG